MVFQSFRPTAAWSMMLDAMGWQAHDIVGEIASQNIVVGRKGGGNSGDGRVQARIRRPAEGPYRRALGSAFNSAELK